MKAAKRKQPSASRGFDRLYTLFALLAAAAALFPFWRIGERLLHMPALPGLLLYAGLLAFGYFLGLPFAKRQRGGYDFTFEGTQEKSGVDRLRPLLPCLLILVLAFLLQGFGVFRRYCEGLPNYVSASFLPFLFLFFALAIPICGVFLAMRPFYKLLSLRTLPVYLTVFAIFGIGLPLLGYNDRSALLLSFSVWACCTALVLNQTHLLESVHRAGEERVPFYFRLSNFGMVLLLLGFTLVLLLLFSLFANGLFAILKSLFFLLAAAFFGRDSEGNSIVSPSEEGGTVARGLFENAFLDGASVYFFLLVFVLTLCFFLFGRKYHPLKRIAGFFRRFMELLNRLMENFAGKSLSRTALPGDLPPDFIDEVRRQAPDAVYDRPSPSQRGGYRDFTRALTKCGKDGERLLLCYPRLLLSLRKMGFGLLPSDTPREALPKIKAHLTFPEAEEITSLFEELLYAEREPERVEYQPLIQKMLEMIKKYEETD